MHKSFKILCMLFGGIVFLIGAIAIFGWYTKNVALIQILPNFVPMQYNTALGFLMSGLATILLIRLRKLSGILGILIFLLGFITLLQYLFKIHLGLDEIFLKHYIMVKTTHSGRMAPNTALCFSLTGLALFLISYIRRYDWTKSLFLSLSIIIGVLGIVALFGYFINMPTAYGWGSLTGMALHTSINFLLISVAFICFFMTSSAILIKRSVILVPLIVFLITALLFILFWFALYTREEKQANTALENETRFIGEKITTLLVSEAQSLDRLFSRTNTGSYTSKQTLANDANYYLKHMQALEFIGLSKSPYSVGKIIFKRDDLSLEKVKLLEEQCDKTLLKSENTNGVLCRMVGFPGFLCVYDGGLKDLAVLSLNKLMLPLSTTSLKRGYAFQFAINKKTVYNYPDDFVFVNRKRHFSINLSKLGANMHIQLWPTSQALRKNRTIVPLIFAILGVFFTIILTLLAHIWQVSLARNKQLVMQEKEIKNLAYYDYLTSIPNRAQFEKLVPQLLIRAKHIKCLLSILIIDLDGFKKVNDTLGHAMGDLLLKKVVERIRKVLRKTDVLARFGGDEFLVVIDAINEIKQVEVVADKILNKLKRPFRLKGRKVTVTASIGIATYPYAGKKTEDLIKHADVAMYQAKRIGKDIYQHYNKRLQHEADQYLNSENDLRYAIEKEKFSLEYQPIYNVNDNTIYAVEALLRWPVEMFVNTKIEEVIDIAEDTGLIVPLGKVVINLAFQQYQLWSEKFDPGFKLSINISPKQLLTDDWLDFVKAALDQYQVTPASFILEITETDLIKEMTKTQHVLVKLVQMGFEIFIDDFGVGYSSLKYIKDLPITGVKIDEAFIRAVDNPVKAKSSQQLITSILMLIANIDLMVVVEGIENASQLDFMKAYPNSKVQGFYLAKPMSADELFKLFS